MSLVNMSDYMTALIEKQDAIEEKLDLLLAENEDYYSDVALGLVADVINFKKAGGNPTIGTTQRVINWGNTTINLITTASTISFVSSSTLDTAAGTGARSILIQGIDALGAEQTEVLALNGTGAVVTTKTWTKVLNRVQVASSGSLLTNQGAITGTANSGVVCTMATGTGLMKQLAYVVPTGKKALFHSYFFDASKNSGGTQKVDIFFYALQNGVKYELFIIRVDQSAGIDVFVTRNFRTPIPFLPGTVWWCESKTDSGTFWVDGEIEQTIHTT